MENNFNTNIGTNLETNHTLDFSDRLYKVALAFIGVLGVIGAGWVVAQFSALPANMPREISITGEGKAYVKPDIALATFGVTTQEMKSQDAVDKNNTKMNAVIKAIKDLGVDEKDIQTTLYNLNPVYDYPNVYLPSKASSDGSVVSSPAYVSGGRVFGGYSLEQQIAVKIRDFSKINSILDKATSSGATNVGQLQFTVDDPEKARTEARAKAIENAKEKLKSLADQSGLRVGKLVNVYEGYNGYPTPYYGLGMGGGAKDVAVTSVAPEIQTGQQEVSVSVTLNYQIK